MLNKLRKLGLRGRIGILKGRSYEGGTSKGRLEILDKSNFIMLGCLTLGQKIEEAVIHKLINLHVPSVVGSIWVNVYLGRVIALVMESDRKESDCLMLKGQGKVNSQS